jgi:hypothetical protein
MSQITALVAGGFADLARPCQYLYEAAFFPHPLQQVVVDGFVDHKLLNVLSNFTQHVE